MKKIIAAFTSAVTLFSCMSADMPPVPVYPAGDVITQAEDEDISDEFSCSFFQSYLWGDYVEIRNWNNKNKTDSAICDVVIPETIQGLPVKAISSGAFSGADNLGKVTLPDSITFLYEGTFRNSSVTEVNIPKSLRFVPDRCFAGCKKLKKVTIADEVIAVSQNAFEDSSYEMPEKYVDENTVVFDELYCTRTVGDDWVLRFMNQEDGKLSVSIAKYIGTDEVLTIPEKIEGFDFIGTEEVIIGENFDNIIEGNKYVKEVIVGKDVKSVPYLQSEYLEKVTIADGIKTVNFLNNCTALKSLVLPPSVKLINGLNGCTSLEKLEIQGDDVTITGYGISGTGLKELELPGNCSISIEDVPECLETIRFRGGKSVSIENGAFAGSSVKNLIFTDKVDNVNIGFDAFKGSALESIVLPEGNISIAYDAFRNCKKLKEVTVNGDAEVNVNTFSGCEALEKVSFNGMSKISDLAFDGCTALADVNFDLSDNISARCFNNCPNLFSINGEEVIKGENTSAEPAFEEYMMKNCHTVNNVGFMNRYTLNNVKKVVSETVDDSMNEMQKAKVLHDWVCAHAEYDLENEADYGNHVDSAVFMDGLAVCEGYAKTYNLLLHEAGVESCYVHNRAHAWNLVKIDGKWFHIDTTWDDTEPVNSDWFMKRDVDFIKAGGDHASWSIELPSVLHSFQPEELPACVTMTGDMDADNSITYADAEKLRDMIVGKKGYAVEGDYNYDGVLSAYDAAEAYERVPDSGIRMGDVNADGITDAKDASEVLAEYVNVSVGGYYTFPHDYVVRADLNVNGRVDASDASVILGYYSYLSTGGTDSIAKYMLFN